MLRLVAETQTLGNHNELFSTASSYFPCSPDPGTLNPQLEVQNLKPKTITTHLLLLAGFQISLHLHTKHATYMLTGILKRLQIILLQPLNRSLSLSAIAVPSIFAFGRSSIHGKKSCQDLSLSCCGPSGAIQPLYD